MRAPEWIRCPRRVLIALGVIVLLAGGLRIASAASPDLANPSTDEIAYASIARGLTHGRYQESLHWPPGAPAMFAVAQKLFPDRELRAAFWAQALVGTLLVGVVFLLGRLAWGPLVGLGAAALVAVYPPYVTLAGQLLSEPLGTLLLAAGVAALLAAWRVRRWWAYVASGVLLGGTLLTRTDLLLVPGILAVATVVTLRSQGARAALTGPAALLAATLVTILPWTVFASHRAGHFVPITEGSGSALFVGTYLPGDGSTTGVKRALAGEVRAKLPRYAHTEPGLIPALNVLDVVAARRPQLARDAALNAEARANLRRYAWGDPLGFGAMMAHKASRMWLVSSRAGVATKSSVTRTVHFVIVLALALALLASCLLLRPAAQVTLLAVLAYGTVLHAVFVSKPRYALPLLPLLAVGGLAAVAALISRRTERTRPSG